MSPLHLLDENDDERLQMKAWRTKEVSRRKEQKALKDFVNKVDDLANMGEQIMFSRTVVEDEERKELCSSERADEPDQLKESLRESVKLTMIAVQQQASQKIIRERELEAKRNDK